MNARNMFVLFSLLSAPLTAHAAFVTPDDFGWQRGDALSVYTQWEFFSNPSGGNAPDAGVFPDPLPDGWTEPDVVESSGTSFITSSGNIYSFSTPTSFDVTVPNYGLGRGPAGPFGFVTTAIVQMRTLGRELAYDSVLFGGFAAAERVELNRGGSGSPFGGLLVDTLFRFELPGNASDYLLTFDSNGSSMSLDRLSIDTFVGPGIRSLPVGPTLPGPADGLGDVRPIPAPSFAGLALCFGVAGLRRRR